MLHKRSLRYVIAIILIMFFFGFIIGLLTQKFLASDQSNIPTTSQNNSKTYEDTEKEKTFESPNGKKQLIIKNDPQYRDDSKIHLLIEDGKETKLEGAVDPIRVSWSPMSEKTSLLYGGPSAGNHLIIYNLATKNMVNTAELSEFLNSPENKGHVIDHTYSVDVGWFEEDLLVSIQGYGGDFKATPQLYLIDSDTGKVIKRLK